MAIEVTNLELESEQGGDHARVSIKAFDLEASFADGSLRVGYGDGAFDVEWSAEDGDERGTVSYDGECFRSETESYGDSYDDEACRGDENFPPLPEDLSEIVPAITAVRVDGAWFLSPTRTVLDSIVQVLRLIDEEDLEGFFEGSFGLGFGGLLYLPFYMGGGFSESSESFSEVGDSIEVSPEMEACYDAQAELTEEEWEEGAVPSECEGLPGWSDFPEPPTTAVHETCFDEGFATTTIPGAKPELQACLDE